MLCDLPPDPPEAGEDAAEHVLGQGRAEAHPDAHGRRARHRRRRVGHQQIEGGHIPGRQGAREQGPEEGAAPHARRHEVMTLQEGDQEAGDAAGDEDGEDPQRDAGQEDRERREGVRDPVGTPGQDRPDRAPAVLVAGPTPAQ